MHLHIKRTCDRGKHDVHINTHANAGHSHGLGEQRTYPYGARCMEHAHRDAATQMHISAHAVAHALSRMNAWAHARSHTFVSLCRQLGHQVYVNVARAGGESPLTLDVRACSCACGCACVRQYVRSSACACVYLPVCARACTYGQCTHAHAYVLLVYLQMCIYTGRKRRICRLALG